MRAAACGSKRIKAKSFTIDGEAVVVGPDGLSRFEDLRRREAAHKAVLYAFDLMEHDGDDVRDLPFLDRKNALARLLRDTNAGILLNEHAAEDGPTVFAHACRLGAEGIVSKKVDGTYRSGLWPVWIKVRNPASIAVQRERSAALLQRILKRRRRRWGTSVSIRRLWAAREARSALRAARAAASRFRSSTSPARVLRWASMADSAALVRPRRVASATAASIWLTRAPRSATLWLATSPRREAPRRSRY